MIDHRQDDSGETAQCKVVWDNGHGEWEDAENVCQDAPLLVKLWEEKSGVES